MSVRNEGTLCSNNKKNPLSAQNFKGGRDRVERLVKYLCVRKGNRHIIGNKSHKTTFVTPAIKLKVK